MPDLHETINQFLEGSIASIGRDPVIESKSITANGTYTAPEGVDGYSPVVVNVQSTAPVIESKNITENGTYTAPEGVDGYSPITVNVPLPENTYLLKSVANLPQPIASFNDGADAPMKSLKVAIEPQQDLHGYDAPWAGGAGKNKFDESILLECSGWTVSNGVYSGNSASVNAKYGSGVPNLNFETNKQYTVSFTYGQDGEAGIGFALTFRYTDNTTSQKYCTLDSVGSVSFTSTAGKTVQKLELSYGANRTIYLSKMQLEEGSSATSYAPYSNICPISGWSEANVTVADATTDPTVENIYTIDLDGTRYGGEVDVVNGIVTPAPYYASYNGETLTGEWISDRDKYEVGATPTIGAQVVNIGASGTPVSILPTAIKSLRGVNNVYANTGDITDAEYFSKEG